MPNAHIITYGCQMNFHDSEHILGVLADAGYAGVDSPEQADLILLNTCAVREKPERKVVSKLGELATLKRDKPDLVLGVCGCMASEWGQALLDEVPAVDLVVGPSNISELPRLLLDAADSGSAVVSTDFRKDIGEIEYPTVRGNGLKAFVNVVFGCSRYCTFCIVPFTRGPERSRPVEAVIKEVEGLVAEGYKEVTVLGQAVTTYGRDLSRVTGHESRVESRSWTTLAFLLARLNEVEGLARIRFTAPHPADFDDELIEAVAGLDKVCEHVHLPLQSGDDRILRKMNRRHAMDDYRRLVDSLRSRVPEIAVSTDLIVGFPGETDEEYQHTLDVVREVRFSQAFMFEFSPKKGTAAARMRDQVPPEIKSHRMRALADLQNEISREVNQQDFGKTFEVLVEGPSSTDPSKPAGRTRQNKIAIFESAGDCPSPQGGRVDCPPRFGGQSPESGDSPRPGDLVDFVVDEAFLWGYKGVPRSAFRVPRY